MNLQKGCYHIAWSAERVQKVKTQKLQRLKMGKSWYCLDVKCVAVKNQNSSKSKKPLGCWAN